MNRLPDVCTGQVDYSYDIRKYSSIDKLGSEGVTIWGADEGWCISDQERFIGNTDDPFTCWNLCRQAVGDSLSSSILGYGNCFCQEGCQCMSEGMDSNVKMVTRSNITDLPEKCDTASEKHVDKGWCYSELDFLIGKADDPMRCWEMCEQEFGLTLVASDLWRATDECFCQDSCDCMASDTEQVYMVTR